MGYFGSYFLDVMAHSSSLLFLYPFLIFGALLGKSVDSSNTSRPFEKLLVENETVSMGVIIKEN